MISGNGSPVKTTVLTPGRKALGYVLFVYYLLVHFLKYL